MRMFYLIIICSMVIRSFGQDVINQGCYVANELGNGEIYLTTSPTPEVNSNDFIYLGEGNVDEIMDILVLDTKIYVTYNNGVCIGLFDLEAPQLGVQELHCDWNTFSSEFEIENIMGLNIDPINGNIIGSGIALSEWDLPIPIIITIDPYTGQWVPFSQNNNSFLTIGFGLNTEGISANDIVEIEDLAVSPCNNFIYVLADVVSTVNDYCFKLSMTDGIVIEIVELNGDIDGIAYDNNNILYGSDGGVFHLINWNTGDLTALDVIDDNLTNNGLADFEAMDCVINRRPVVNDDNAGSVCGGAEFRIDVLQNDFNLQHDIDYGTLDIIIQPEHGSISVDESNGEVIYLPSTNYEGVDSFSYRICDDGTFNECTGESFCSNIAKVELHVTDCFGFGCGEENVVEYLYATIQNDALACIQLSTAGIDPTMVDSIQIWTFVKGTQPTNVSFQTTGGTTVNMDPSQAMESEGGAYYYETTLMGDGSDFICAATSGDNQDDSRSMGTFVFYKSPNGTGGYSGTRLNSFINYDYAGASQNGVADCTNEIIAIPEGEYGTSRDVTLKIAFNNVETGDNPVTVNVTAGDEVQTFDLNINQIPSAGGVLLAEFGMTEIIVQDVINEITQLEIEICSLAEDNGADLYPNALIAYSGEGCCSGLRVNVVPEYDFDFLCQNEQVELTAVVEGAQGEIFYQWYYDDVILLGATQPTATANIFLANSTAIQFVDYSVRVTVAGPDGQGEYCSKTSDPLNIEYRAIPGLDIEFTDTICVGEPMAIDFAVPYDGGEIVNIQILSGDFDDVIVWEYGLGVAGVSPTVTTSYLTTVHYNGCYNDKLFTVHVVPDLQIEILSDANTICTGEEIELTANVLSGNNEVIFTWTLDNQFISNEPTIVANTEGLYELHAINANLCEGNEATFLIVSSVDIEISSDVEPILCAGNSTGSIFLFVENADEPLEFLWNDGLISQHRGDLAAGVYSVVITDANGCIFDAGPFEIEEPELFTSSSISLNEQTCNGCDGFGTVQVSGGVEVYFFLWDDPLQQTTQTAENLCPGTYTVHIWDNNGCGLTETITIEEKISDVIINDYSYSESICEDSMDGVITMDASSSYPPLYYDWFSNGQMIASGEGLNSISDLPSGEYSAVVRDDINCEENFGPITIINTPGLFIYPETQNETCFGNDGFAHLNIFGGIEPYTVLWSDDIDNHEVTRNDLTQGNYIATVIDSVGCIKEVEFAITAPQNCCGDFGVTYEITEPTCNGDIDGTIELILTGGQEPYIVEWMDGSDAFVRNNLPAGNYYVQVSDYFECETLLTVVLSQPEPIVVTIDVIGEQSSADACMGEVKIDAMGCEGQFFITVVNEEGYPVFPPYNNLCAGYYTVHVQDSKGCSNVESFVICEPSCSLDITETNGYNSSCPGACDGSVSVAANSPGTIENISWYHQDELIGETATVEGLCAGTYKVVVSDDLGCVKSATITVNDVAPLSILGFDLKDESAPGANDGWARAYVTGGNEEYSFAWNNQANVENEIATELAAGLHEVVITDESGCSITGRFEIASNECSDFVVLSNKTNVSCNGANDGSIVIDFTGNEGAVNFNWAPEVSSSSTASDLGPGAYLITVSDEAGCSRTITQYVFEPIAMKAESAVCPVTCTGVNNGVINLEVSGGTEPYIFIWDDGSLDEDKNNVSAGNYSVIIKDQKGCEIQHLVVVEEASELNIITDIYATPTCNDINGGAIDLQISGGSGNYSFEWSDGAISEDREGLASGEYAVIITDQNGCADERNIEIPEVECFMDVELTVTSSSDIAVPGDYVNFTVTVINLGPEIATDVTVASLIPNGTSHSLHNENQGVYNEVTGIWNIQSLAVNQTVELVITVLVVDIDNPINFFAQVASALPDDVDSTPNNNNSNIPSEDDEDVAIVIEDPNLQYTDLALTKTADVSIVHAGDNVTYLLVIENLSNVNATDVLVRDVLPNAVSYSSSFATQGEYDPNSSIWTVGNVNAGDSRTLEITVLVVDASDSIVNFAQVSNASPEDLNSTPDNNNTNIPIQNDESAVTVEPGSVEIDVALDITSTLSIISLASNVEYQIHVVNLGPDVATNVMAQHFVPSEFLYLDSSNDAGFYNPITGTWVIGSLNMNEEVILTIQAQLVDESGASVVIKSEIVTANEIDIDSTPNNNVLAEDDQDELVIDIITAGYCEGYEVCTEPVTPITICPDFCDLQSPWSIENAASSYQCSISIENDCIVYTPLPGIEQLSPDQVTIIACDFTGYCEETTIVVNIGNCDGLPPVAQEDEYSVTCDPIVMNVLLNDSDPDSDFTICDFNQPSHGSVALNGDQFYYTPVEGFEGNTSFQYTICDPQGNEDTATVFITFDCPGCEDEVLILCTPLLTPIEICPEFCDYPTGTYTLCDATTTYSCSITYINDECIRYTPLPAFSGNDVIHISVCTNAGDEFMIDVQIQVGGCYGSPPVAVDDFAITDDNETITIPVLDNDYDPDNDTFEICANTEPNHGSLALLGDSFVYTPFEGFAGQDEFNYTICDENGDSDQATVTILVEQNCDDYHYDCTEVLTPIEFCIDFCNSDAEITNISTTHNCSITQLNNHCFRYIPLPLFSGVDMITFLGCDDQNNCETHIIELTVGGCDGNESPVVANDDSVNAQDGFDVLINILQNDVFPSICPEDLTIISVTTSGEAVIDDNGQLRFTPNANTSPFVEIVYELCACGFCDQATANISYFKLNQSDIQVPNGFTPNNDGSNDLFTIQELSGCTDCTSASITIINNQGMVVYENNNFIDNASWDGYILTSSKVVEEGTYFYILNWKSAGTSHTKNGYIEIRK